MTDSFTNLETRSNALDTTFLHGADSNEEVQDVVGDCNRTARIQDHQLIIGGKWSNRGINQAAEGRQHDEVFIALPAWIATIVIMKTMKGVASTQGPGEGIAWKQADW
jgi:hypothetical protein